MFDIKTFYSTYQYDYYVYKLVTFKRIIDNIEKFETDFLKEVINGYSRQDYIRTLKSEIRQTLYHSIETLFELIFALIPPNEKELNDKDILVKLTKSKWSDNYQTIHYISSSEYGLDFLDKKLKIQGHYISTAQYLFYFGILPDNQSIPKEYLNKIEDSITAIKHGIKTIAKEFADRKEYNSYKHAMRIVPAVKHFYILNSDTKKSIMDWDLTDSMTFLHLANEDEMEFITKMFDTQRDIGLTLFCSNLISNIILIRKLSFKQVKPDEKIPVLFFGLEEVKKLNKPNVAVQSIRHKIKKNQNVS